MTVIVNQKMATSVLYFFSGNPCVYAVYDEFFQLLRKSFTIVVISFPLSVQPQDYTSWLHKKVFSQISSGRSLPNLEASDAIGIEPLLQRTSFPRCCNAIAEGEDGSAVFWELSQSDAKRDVYRRIDAIDDPRYLPENAYALAHSYGAWHAVRLHQHFNFKKLVLVGPFLMRPPREEAYNTLKIVGNCSVRMVFHAVMAFSAILPDFGAEKLEFIDDIEDKKDEQKDGETKDDQSSLSSVVSSFNNGLWYNLFGARKDSVEKQVAMQVQQIVNWEFRTIAAIDNFSDIYRVTSSKEEKDKLAAEYRERILNHQNNGSTNGHTSYGSEHEEGVAPIGRGNISEADGENPAESDEISMADRDEIAGDPNYVEGTRVFIDASTTYCILPTSPLDRWSSEQIFNDFPDSSREKMEVAHAYIDDPNHSVLVADKLIELFR